MARFKKGQIPWNKGKTFSEESKRKMSQTHKGQKSWNKGKKASEESKRKMSVSAKLSINRGRFTKGHKPSEETIKKQKETYRRTLSNPEVRKKMSESHKGQVAWNKSKKTSKETIIKLRLSHLGQKSWNKGRKGLQVAWNKGKKGYLTSEARKKISEAHKGKSSWNKGINFPTELERSESQIRISRGSRERILKLLKSGKFPQQTNTKPERKIKEELIKRGYKEGIDFIHQYKFMNKYMCDFCFPQQKIILEVNGDYWHCNPKKYSKPIYQPQIRGIKKDKSKEAYITKVDNNSWAYLVLWESDINEDVSKCVDKIEEVLKEKKKI